MPIGTNNRDVESYLVHKQVRKTIWLQFRKLVKIQHINDRSIISQNIS